MIILKRTLGALVFTVIFSNFIFALGLPGIVGLDPYDFKIFRRK